MPGSTKEQILISAEDIFIFAQNLEIVLEFKILVCSCDRWHKHAGRRKITPPSPESYQFACMACTCLIDRRGGGGNQGGGEVSNARAAVESTERLGNKILRPRAAGERAGGDGRTSPKGGRGRGFSSSRLEAGSRWRREREGGRLRGVISIGAVTYLNGDFTQPTDDEVQEEHNLLRPIGVRVEAWDMIDTHARAQKRERVGSPD